VRNHDINYCGDVYVMLALFLMCMRTGCSGVYLDLEESK
jgi:hypothetical protein